VVVGLGSEPRLLWTLELCKVGLDPLIQVEAVVQEDAKGQEASRQSVKRANGSEVRIVNDKEKKQQEGEKRQLTPRPGAWEAGGFTVEALRTRTGRSAQRTFSLPFP
jgi:hypothetical protein